jgi:hypothetical protein
MTAFYSSETVHVQDVFREADLSYDLIKQKVQSADWSHLPHSEVERQLFDEGAELLRRLLQSHLTLRGQSKPSVSVVGADDCVRSHVREATGRGIESIFGTVRVERPAYSGRGLSALHPVDADLNLPGGRFSLEVERRVAQFAARNSFDATADLICTTTRASVAKRQIENLTRNAALDFTEFYAQRDFDAEILVDTGPLLILTFDQKGIVMRPEDLLDATRKIAKGNLRKLQTRYSRGEPHGRKRMATVAAVYTSQPHYRSALDVIKGLQRLRDLAPTPRPSPELKRLWASVKDDPLNMVRTAFEEALNRDPLREKRWIVLIDGDNKLRRWIKKVAKEHAVTVTYGLDMIHALQYLWKAGKAFHKEGSTELEGWVLERLYNILEGKVSDVVAGMTRSATLQGLSKEKREPVDRCARYFLKRKHMMRYEELLRIGAPIATGVVEGGCKYLINDRLDITGARWSLEGAEAVLRLRAMVTSGDFNEYWLFHEAKERHRNHVSSYAGGQVPAVIPTWTGKARLRSVKAN